MIYITVKQSPAYHQMTFEELLYQENPKSFAIESKAGTKTYAVESVSDRFKKVDVEFLIKTLSEFNEKTKNLRETQRHNLYRTFYIPKKSGGMRKIDAPNQELMEALRNLKTLFENKFHALYHTSAYAYIKNRCILDCMKKHQANESKWFAKYDLSNFFGSTTKEFVTRMFSMIYPFSEVLKNEDGKREFETAIDLAFLDGGLPQGTPISPIITNIMMIPIDFKIANTLTSLNNQRFIYTRYADDFQISSRYDFDFRMIERFIAGVLHEFGAPFRINEEKTRYGSSAGSNWNLGLMLNKDNKITVGYQNKRRFKAMLTSYIMDKKNGIHWDKSDIYALEGHRSYYRMVEKDTIDKIVEHIDAKFGVNVVSMIKKDLKPQEQLAYGA